MLFLKWHWHDFQVYFEATWSIRKAKWHYPEIWWLTILFHEKEGLFGCYLGVIWVYPSFSCPRLLPFRFGPRGGPPLRARSIQASWRRGCKVYGPVVSQVCSAAEYFSGLTNEAVGVTQGYRGLRCQKIRDPGSRSGCRGWKWCFFTFFFGKMRDCWGWTAACLCGQSRTAWAPSPSWWMQLVHILG